MKQMIFLVTALCVMRLTSAQSREKDSLLALLSKAKEDTVKVNLLSELSDAYYNSNPDSSFLFAENGLQLAESLGYKKGEINCKLSLAAATWVLGDFATSIKLGYLVLDYAIPAHDTSAAALARVLMANSYRDQGDYREALLWASKNDAFKTSDDCSQCSVYNGFIASCYYGMAKFDSALFYLTKALLYPRDYFYGWISLIMARTQQRLGNNSEAFEYYHRSIKALSAVGNLKDLAAAYADIAGLYETTGQTDSSISYGHQALNLAQERKFNKVVPGACLILSKAYEKINTNEALKYYKLAIEANNNLYNQDKQRQILSYQFNEQLRQREEEQKAKEFKSKIRLYSLLAALAVFLVIAYILYRNNRHKQRAYALLQKQKQEIDIQRAKTEQTLQELRSAQAQLIQSEKMASLGELTAGIAHEIQNPLNFVNNFSDVNKELLTELNEEIEKGNYGDAKAIAKDVIDNEEKINHHGKRADSIVKGMLQHSGTSSGQKELTDINKLTEEYLRLAYHGLRAKDKSFNAKFETDFDKSVGKINIIPQDVGRVILNLINNAFYAVSEKVKLQAARYKPLVAITTKREQGNIEIRVADNGNGIPQKIIDKIFQPFFTTKPTGEGTGLGLSLAYDIVKAHGGEIKVETKEGDGTVFTIILNS
jgi:signal transduction histidine kinase